MRQPVSFKVNERRVEAISDILSSVQARNFLDLIESSDIQFKVTGRIVNMLGDEVKTAVLIVGTALISYQLSAKGEVHWRYFEGVVEHHKDKGPKEILLTFLDKSPSTNRMRGVKRRRIERFFLRFVPLFEEEFSSYTVNLEEFREDLAKAMKSYPNAKTIVFATKMFYYVLKALGLNVNIPPSIPIPVDHRVCLVTLTSGIVESSSYTAGFSRLANSLRSKHAESVRRVWNRISSLSSTPSLKIDSLLWILGGVFEDSNFNFRKTITLVEKLVNRKLSRAEKDIIREFMQKAIEVGRERGTAYRS
ncbi:MAG: hypothetical protein DRJ51_03375 [Thermoprotei archaeon]|nr:MAG: hypothetical protein DRJ51_03375 [Thermoprotei archaeon]RLF01107.1 MAG: hypothetical protein DRJ59_06735 [Thermoprotei archaeon]